VDAIIGDGRIAIIDFMNLGSGNEFVSKIIEKAYWYPLDEIELV